MADSRIPAACDKLIEIFTAAMTPFTGDEAVTMYDGPELEPEKGRRVFVGYDGNPDGEMEAVVSDQVWSSSVAVGRRNEDFAINCAVAVDDGTSSPKAARDAVFALFALLSTAVRDNKTLGFPPPARAQVRNPVLTYTSDPNYGLEARVAFQVAVFNRI